VLVRNLTLSGIRSEHTVRVSTIYQFVTVFNHSDHAITFLPENITVDTSKHYRVPPRIYLTLPLFGAGMVESCQREVIYTVVSEGVSIAPTVIGLTFTEENNNINMPFPDVSLPVPTVTFPPQPAPLIIPEIPLTQTTLISPLPLPVTIDNFPIPVIQQFTTKHDLIRAAIPRSGTLAVSASISFTAHTSYVSRCSLIVRTERESTLIIRERIDTPEGEGIYTQVASLTVPAANSPFTHSRELVGNMVEVILTNGTLGTSTYDISMLGHI